MQKLLRGKVAQLDQTLGQTSFKTVLLVRLVSAIPFDMQNYGLGFSQVKFGPYAWATVWGLLPWTVVYVYLGHTLTDSHGVWTLAVGLVAITALLSYSHRWYLNRRRIPT